MTHGTRTARAFLLLHGLTASPKQFEVFGRLLFERGSNVYIPRLPRHGLADRLTTELQGLTADELLGFADASAALATTLGDAPIVVGFSVGGLLAAWLGQHRRFARATAVAPFLGVAWIPHALTASAARATLAMPNRFLWWDPIRRERRLPAHGYPRFATHAIAHAARIASDLLADAERRRPATADLQVVLNASESTVSNPAARRLARAWSRARPATIVLHRLRGLPPSHDIIEPLAARSVATHLYPQLLALVDR